MNVPVYCDDKVECKATHPALLDTNPDNNIEVPPRNWNIPKSDPSPVRRSVLGNGLEEVRWDLAQVPRRKGFWVTARENVTTKIALGNHLGNC